MDFAKYESLPEWLSDLPMSKGRIVFPELGIDLPYREVARRAAGFADILRRNGVRADDVVGVLAPVGPEFLIGFFGVLWAGATVSVLPAPTLGADAAKQLDSLIRSADMRFVIVAEAFGRMAAELQGAEHSPVMVPIGPHVKPSSTEPFEPGRTMVVQLTSGSIAAPKGVQLPFAAYRSGLADVHEVCRFSSEDIVALWLPLSHDFGLNTLLCAMATDANVHLVNPHVFFRKPVAFLQCMDRIRATIFASPNFAYDRLVAAAEQLEPSELDLSSWRMAWNGGEVVREDTVARFARAFAHHGVDDSVMSPVYGMAEVAGPIAGAPAPPNLRIMPIHRDSLRPGSRIRVSSSDDADSRSLVSSGPQFGRSIVRIVDASGTTLPDQTVGEIEFQGPSGMTGYHNNIGATKAALRDGWLRSGDLGFRSEGEVFITGRIKDMIIVAGRNFHAEDVEEIAGSTPGVHRKHCAVVADVEHEKLVVVVELATGADVGSVVTAVRARTQERLQLTDISVHPVRRGWLPRTTSGKWQRHKLLSKLAFEELR